MTRHGGGSHGMSGGGGFQGNGANFGSHGRSGGGSFGPPSHHEHHHHHHPPPPPGPPFFHRQPYFPVTQVVYSAPVTTYLDRKTELLYRINSAFFFTIIAMCIGMFLLYSGLYCTTTIQLGVHDSRLLSAVPILVHSIKFKNQGDMEGPVLYEFNHKPSLDQQLSWLDYQNVTFSYGHREFFYWMNKGSTVVINYVLQIWEKSESVFFKILQDNPDNLSEYWERPNQGSSIRLHENGVVKYEASASADYAFSLVSYNKKSATVYLDMHFNTMEYNTEEATDHHNLKTSYDMEISIFGSRYGLLKGPGAEKMGVDTWEVEISYGVPWILVLFLFGFVILVHLGLRTIILCSVFELDPSVLEHAPLLLPEPTPQESQATAPTLPVSISEEYSSDWKAGEPSEDQLCSICLDARKDCFFVPCGHRATCHDCGLRVSKSDQPNCPICRHPIGEVKKIYDA